MLSWRRVVEQAQPCVLHDSSFSLCVVLAQVLHTWTFHFQGSGRSIMSVLGGQVNLGQ